MTINGSNFEQGATVSFGSAAATSVTFANPTQLQAVAPPNAVGSATVEVANPDGGTASLPDAFAYDQGPAVTSVSPSSGPATGGTSVTITGSGFESGAGVAFGVTPAASVTVISPTEIQAVTPAESAAATAVTVTNTDSTIGTLTSAFTFLANAAAAPPPISSGALLTGMTPSNYTLPAGWTLVDANDFSSGYHAGEGPANTGGNTIVIDCSFGHAGNCSLDSNMTRSAAGYGMVLNGNYINSREVYVSYWMYVSDSNPGYGFDYTNWYHLVRVPQGETVGQGLDFDFVPSGPPNCWFACVGGSASFFGNIPGYGWGRYGAWYNQTPGRWVQLEFHVKANTPGENDGDLEYYVNGALVAQCDASNGCPSNGGATPGDLVQNSDYMTANLYLGGDWMANMWYGDAAQTIFSTAGDVGYGSTNANMGACQDAIMCPPNGVIPPFDIYITDVIIVKR
jgi:hypothetical protein